MGIIGAYAVPHPPLIIPAVGKGSEKGIAATVAAFQHVAREIAATQPDAIVLLSSHAPAYRDGFYVSKGGKTTASMAGFGAPHERFEVRYDEKLSASICDAAQCDGVPTCGYDPNGRELDHASFIPLWFVRTALTQMANAAAENNETENGAMEESCADVALPPIVRIGLSWLPFETHRALGQAIARAIESSGKRVVVVASGDLSHRLLADGPYGFREEGPVFDELVTGIFARGSLCELFDIDEQLTDGAGECGLRPFMIMAGALEAQHYAQQLEAQHYAQQLDAQPLDAQQAAQQLDAHLDAQLLSYEGPFGVGYAVASFVPQPQAKQEESIMQNHPDSETNAAPVISAAPQTPAAPAAPQTPAAPETSATTEKADPFVALARESVEHFVRTGSPLTKPDDLPDDLLNQRAGAFVSLHSHGDLRGCIGTISACTQCLADEIIANGVSAAACDPRFPAVRPEELDDIEYSVDVLGAAEAISSTDELDPVRYGVIVTKGRRRGLLLPNLDGVDTVEQQLSIARAKAGIGEWEQGVELERFEVVRHTLGGEARNER